MENACYYTFSTISQTLAGAFGFLVAVVLYQIQMVTGRLENLRTRFGHMEHLADNKDFTQAENDSDWSTMGILMEANSPLPMPPNAFEPEDLLNHEEQRHHYEPKWRALLEGGYYDRFIQHARQLASIKKGLERSLKGTGATIGLSLALLMFTPLIAGHGWLAWVCLVLDVFFASLCLWSYFPLVNSVTK